MLKKNPMEDLVAHADTLNLDDGGWRKCYLFPTLAPDLLTPNQI